MLKADLHLHAKEDVRDTVKYTVKELIDHMASLGFNVVALTFHDQSYRSEEMNKYAASKGITIIPAIERTIEKTHVLIYNLDPKKAESIKTFEDLKKIKSKDILITAPHPFFFLHSVGKFLDRKIEFFDALEYSSFYQALFNRNKLGAKAAKKYNLPLVGGTDAHFLNQIGYTYTLVDSKNNIPSIIKAIKSNKIQLVTRPLPFSLFFKNLFTLLVLSPLKFNKRRK